MHGDRGECQSGVQCRLLYVCGATHEGRERLAVRPALCMVWASKVGTQSHPNSSTWYRQHRHCCCCTGGVRVPCAGEGPVGMGALVAATGRCGVLVCSNATLLILLCPGPSQCWSQLCSERHDIVCMVPWYGWLPSHVHQRALPILSCARHRSYAI